MFQRKVNSPLDWLREFNIVLSQFHSKISDLYLGDDGGAYQDLLARFSWDLGNAITPGSDLVLDDLIDQGYVYLNDLTKLYPTKGLHIHDARKLLESLAKIGPLLLAEVNAKPRMKVPTTSGVLLQLKPRRGA